MKTDILPAQADQIALLGALARRIFIQTFESTNTPEDMDAYMSESMSDLSFANQLNDDLYHTFLVWLGEGPSAQLAGYIQLYFNPNESYEQIPLELKRFYVDPEFHGKGLAGMMMEFTLRKAQSLGQKRIWLGVWENNFRALGFYKKWGFKEIADHPFVMGADVQRDLILACDVDLPN